jgi:raffinose/stachyose/melibiose transport system permease protein
MSRQAAPPQAKPLSSADRAISQPPEDFGTPAGHVVNRLRYRLFSNVVIPWLFILPILIIHIIVVAIPAITGVYYSLTEWSGIGDAKFIGLENFRRLFFEDESFRRALGNNVVWMLFFLTVPFALALLASSLLARIRSGGMIYRTALFIPYLLPSVVTAMIWRNLMNPRLGVGAQLANIGIPGLDVALLGRSDTALLSIAFIDNWHFWGFLMVLFLTAMQSIPMELYEAAKIDGANLWQEFRYVTLPGIRPVVLFMMMMTAIWSFLVFEYIWILTQGGPAGASEVLGTLVYKNAFNRFEAGYGAAQGVTISMFAGMIVLSFVYLRRRGWDI